MDIGKAISIYNKSQDKNFENVVDRTTNARYNALKRESEAQTAINHYEEPAEPEERRADYGIDISLGGRLSNTQLSTGQGAGGGDHEIRDVEKKIPERTPERDLFGDASGWNSNGAFADGAGDSGKEDGASDQTDGRERRRDRKAQSGKPDALGAADEQHSAAGRGDRSAGNHVHPVNGAVYEQLSLFPSVEEQIEKIEAGILDDRSKVSAVLLEEENKQAQQLQETLEKFKADNPINHPNHEEQSVQEQLAVEKSVSEKEAEKVTVALESSEDYSEPGIGFYTHHYADGREGVRYRLVTLGEDGLLVPYPERNRFFINRELVQEYMDAHSALIDVIGYDDMLFQSMQKQSQLKRGQAQAETQDTSRHDANYSVGQNDSKLDYKIGDTVTIEGTEFVIEDISDREVQLRDPKLFYPIFRVESRENFEHLLGKETLGRKEEIPSDYDIEAIGKIGVQKEQGTDAGFSPKEKFRKNIEVIKTLKLLEESSRAATYQERQILSIYSGWGPVTDNVEPRAGMLYVSAENCG